MIGVNLTILAQIEKKNNTIKFEVIEEDFKTPEGLELPAIKLPSIIKPKTYLRLLIFLDWVKKHQKLLISDMKMFF